MDVATSTLPAVSVDATFAAAMRSRMRQGATPTLTIQFTTAALAMNANAMASFSSHGPSVDLGIKPDLVATGAYLYTATQRTNPFSFLYGATGFIKEADGTSFSAPLVSGAVALLKAARPGLTAAQYRSLLINSATPLGDSVQWAGAGVLNVAAALGSTVAVSPVSLSFGTGAGTAGIARELTITNLGTVDDTFTISAGAPIATDANTVRVAAGASQTVALRFSGSLLSAGEYQGYVHIRSTQTTVDTVAPYWYGVPDGVPKYLAELQTPAVGAPGTAQHIYFRVTDLTGLALISPMPSVRAVGLLGTVASVSSEDNLSPGVFHAVVLLGDYEGDNVFEIRAGQVTRQITIVGQN
jgi:hypothetical protein